MKSRGPEFKSPRAHIVLCFIYMSIMEYKNPRLTVDAIILKGESVVLVKRGIEPFKGMWALPGGHVDYNEKVEHAVIRETKEETGLDVKIEKLIGVYSDPKRDPRGHRVAICYLCAITGGIQKANDDAVEVMEFKLSDLPDLAFDHGIMMEDVKKQL